MWTEYLYHSMAVHSLSDRECQCARPKVDKLNSAEAANKPQAYQVV